MDMMYEGKHFSLRKDLAWQFRNKYCQMTFWGLDARGGLDFLHLERYGGFKILGFMFTWHLYGKRRSNDSGKLRNYWYFNRRRHRRELEAQAVSYAEEGFPDIAARIRATM